MQKTIIYSLILLSYSTLSFSQNSISEAQGGEKQFHQLEACLNHHSRQAIQLQLHQNIKDLQATGQLLQAHNRSIVSFDWPIRQAAGFNYNNVYGVSNYVDHNSSFAGNHNNFVTDYNCGGRSYDTGSSYNHQGIDIFTWPFGWDMMDNDQVEIVAAAAGVIIGKDDNNADKNCSFNSSNWNAVYVRHSDGSVAWYGHMKINSLTTKTVGQSVSKGEYLGVVGSSGNSTGPHLHFEVYDINNNLIDPYSGSCNSLNSSSWWQSQKPYYESRINTLLTHDNPPEINTCYPDNSNTANNFAASDRVYFAAYYQDQLSGQVTNYAVYQPNNSLWASWSHNSSEPHYVASYWYWWYTLPSNPQEGQWRFSATFEGQTLNHYFTVGDNCPPNLTVNNPINSTTYQAGFSLTSTGTIDAGKNVIFKAGSEIILNSDFEVEFGANFLATIDGCGSLIENTEVDNRSTYSKTSNKLKNLKITPNPFGQSATLNLFMDEPQEKVSIKIINMTGVTMQQLLENHPLDKGYHSFSIEASQLPNGVYFVQMQTSTEQKGIKMMINK